MFKDIHTYGEVLPGYTLKRITRLQGGQKVDAYSIFDDSAGHSVPVYTFGIKPISYQKFLKDNDKGDGVPVCATEWIFIANVEAKRFKFIPRIGYKIYLAIIESGWDVDKLSAEKRYNEIGDQAVYVFERARRLIEGTL